MLDVLNVHVGSAPVHHVTRSAHASPSYKSSTTDISAFESTFGHTFVWQVLLQAYSHWNNHSCYPLAYNELMLEIRLECHSPIYTLRPTLGVCTTQRLQVKRRSERLGAWMLG
jgi:hypothetical protein